VLDSWAHEAGVPWSFLRPGKPNENAYIESFNGKFRDECLNEHWFVTMAQARRIIESWRIEYNTERTHSSQRNITPEEYAAGLLNRAEDRVSLTAGSKSGRP
jgi:putative transposase